MSNSVDLFQPPQTRRFKTNRITTISALPDINSNEIKNRKKSPIQFAVIDPSSKVPKKRREPTKRLRDKPSKLIN